MCKCILYRTVLLPPGVSSIAVNKYITSTVVAGGTYSLGYSGQLIVFNEAKAGIGITQKIVQNITTTN